ncbi:MAG: GNAT family N-acetyltransferase [Magnetovibrionaceae bacterium]
MAHGGLDALFQPASVCVIGASTRPESLGTTVMRNLLNGAFFGPILPVNPKYESVLGVLCYPRIQDLPRRPDLAVICTPPHSLPEILKELGQVGCRAAIVMTVETGEDENLRETVAEAARASGIRVIGPGSTGIQVPAVGLNASWIVSAAPPGRLALVSQSGAVTAATVEWARAHGVGFSYVVSAGDPSDIDLEDLLDYLAIDPKTRAVLLYVRDVRGARAFLSAARAVARIKPVIIIKGNRRISEQGIGNGPEPDPEAIPNDAVFDAAIRRAGMLRVLDADELFDAAETLAYARPLRGPRLAILCNGRGPAEMAADALIQRSGQLAPLSAKTSAALAEICGSHAGCNPIDIGREADAECYRAAIQALTKDAAVDAVLVMHTPTAMANGVDVAQVTIEAAKKTPRNVLACWLGDTAGGTAVRTRFGEAGIPVYASPDKAVRAFLYMVDYRSNQEMLLQTPASEAPATPGAAARVREILGSAWAKDQSLMDETATRSILKAYGIDSPEAANAETVEEAVAMAERFGWPVSLRLASNGLRRPAAVGNMSFDLTGPDALIKAAEGAAQRFKSRHRGEPLPGFVVQKMIRRPDASVLMAGIGSDPLFGPVIRLGIGGVGAYAERMPAVALPPLNMALADELIQRAGIAPLLAKTAGQPGINGRALAAALVHLSQLIVDHPEISALDINPLLADQKGVVALDGRMRIDFEATAARGLAIRPYPAELEEQIRLRDGTEIELRPIRPEDEPAYAKLLKRLQPQDLYMRFCSDGAGIEREQLAHLTHIDYDREMGFVAVAYDYDNNPEILGSVEIMATPDRQEAEYSILVRSDQKGRGLGRVLMEKIIRYCRTADIGLVFGLILKDNESMLALARKLGYRDNPAFLDDDMIRLDLDLASGQSSLERVG